MPDDVESRTDTLVAKAPPQSSNGLPNAATNGESSGNAPSTSESDIQRPSEKSGQGSRSEHEEEDEEEDEKEGRGERGNDERDPKEKSDKVSTTTTPGGRPSHRPRKTVERLSESLNKRFEQQLANKEKQQELVTTQLQGRGCPLGEIPLIEASIKKSKPADLKLLHFAAFGRPGSVHEIRTNLRRFRGFVFTKSAPEYTKREELLSKRPAVLIREALRVLNLEVSGSRAQLVSRLVDFLCCPSAESVKYKGKLHKKPRRSHTSSAGDKKTKHASGAPRGRKRKAPTEEEREDSHEDSSSNSDESEPIKKGQKAAADKKVKEAEPEEEEEEEDSSEGDQASNDDDDDVYSPGNKKTKRPRKTAKTPKQTKTKASSPASEKKAAVKAAKPAPKKRRTVLESDDEEEDEQPLAKMVPEKQAFPSDEELKTKVIELLKTSNLQETSMKVVRNSIAAQYDGIDLSSKKQYINEVIKEYLSSSL